MQLNTMFQDWLHRRKITDTIIEEFGIEGDNNPILGECIKIPIKDVNGNFLFNKYRRNPMEDIKPKYIYDKGSKVALYGAHKMKDEKTILITEGEMDCLVARSANIPAVSSTGGALSFQEEWKDFFEGKEVIVCFDNDSAGGEGMVRVQKHLPDAKMVFLPKDSNIKDISDYVATGGDLHALISTAKAYGSIEEVREDKGKRDALFLSTFYHEAYIEDWQRRQAPKKAKFTYANNDKLGRAKEYPIDNLLTFTSGKTKCLWHNEKTPSLVYYPKTNSCYCFGCGKVADSIDVYKQLHNSTFKEAVHKLSNNI